MARVSVMGVYDVRRRVASAKLSEKAVGELVEMVPQQFLADVTSRAEWEADEAGLGTEDLEGLGVVGGD
jgi:hypothetical protein